MCSSVTSILLSVKKLLGISEDYTEFDSDLIIHINSVFMILNQLGVGPENGFTISDENATWDDFLAGNVQQLEAVKTYVYMKVRLMFDPPTNSSLVESMNQQVSELEWRLNVAVDP